ncbi:26430_t:CDS:2, partial [Racocetra persica]
SKTILGLFVFDDTKKDSKTILGLLEFFGINRSVDVTLNYYDDIDATTQRVIDEYTLDVTVNDLRLISSLISDFRDTPAVQALYYFLFVFDDLMVFRGIDYIDVISGLESRENKLPPRLSEMLSKFMSLWKNEFKEKYDLIRTEAILWVSASHAAYVVILMMFILRDINCTYLEYRTLQTTFEMFEFYLNELASCLREKNDGELSSVDQFFQTNDFSKIAEYCTKQIYETMKEFEGKCNIMVSLEFMRLCKNSVLLHLASSRYEKFFNENVQ